jgi:hypothetical protein
MAGAKIAHGLVDFDITLAKAEARMVNLFSRKVRRARVP